MPTPSLISTLSGQPEDEVDPEVLGPEVTSQPSTVQLPAEQERPDGLAAPGLPVQHDEVPPGTLCLKWRTYSS